MADIKGVTHWLPGLGPFDAILSIETLEHLPPILHMLWVTTAAQNLTEDGVMVIACPLGEDAKSDYNRYHIFEPTFGTLALMLNTVFERVSIETEEYTDTGDMKATQAIAVCARPRAQEEVEDEGGE